DYRRGPRRHPEGAEGFAGCRLPTANRAIRPPRDNRLAVRRERDGGQCPLMTVGQWQFLARGRIPEADRAAGGRGDLLPVWRERQVPRFRGCRGNEDEGHRAARLGWGDVAQLVEFLAGFRLPQADLLASSADGQRLAVGRKDQGGDAVGYFDLAEFLAS